MILQRSEHDDHYRLHKLFIHKGGRVFILPDHASSVDTDSKSYEQQHNNIIIHVAW